MKLKTGYGSSLSLKKINLIISFFLGKLLMSSWPSEEKNASQISRPFLVTQA
jgi:hypothetical protein